MGEAAAEDQQTPAPRPDSHLEDAVRLAIPLGVALLVIVLVALGLEGDDRSRFIRNRPGAVGTAFALVIAGVSLPLIARSLGRTKRRWGWMGTAGTALGSLLLLAGTVLLVWVGAANIALREQPDIVLTSSAPLDGSPTVDVTVSATAHSLASRDRLLIRVVAVSERATPWLQQICGQPGRSGRELVHIPPEDVERLSAEDGEPAETVLWAEGGPLADGSAGATHSMRIDRSEHRHVCVFAALTSAGDPQDERFSLAVHDLDHSTVAAPATTPGG